MINFRAMLCNHDWSILSKDTIPSGFDVMSEHQDVTSIGRAPHDFCVRKIVIVATCSKCGKIKCYKEAGGK